MKRIVQMLAALLFAAGIAGLTACGGTPAPAPPSPTADANKIQVSVTFDAMGEFARAVGKDWIEVSVIVPNSASAHSFEPKAQDLVDLSTADLLVYNGLGMEPWIDSAVQAANNPNLILVETSANVIPLVAEESGHEHGTDPSHEENHSQERVHSHGGGHDPHTWLSPKAAREAVKSIQGALTQADPDGKDYYENNCADYLAKLQNLIDEYEEKFAATENKSFITGHAAFGYLCRDFGLNQSSVEGVFAQGEPTAQQLVKLVEYSKANRVTTIFSEEAASPLVSETLANEVGAKVAAIYTMESAEDGKSYLERMSDNLSKIYESLSES
jgi:zinc transport system substrate-binding protein